MNLPDFMVFMNPAEWWKRCRKILHSLLSKQAITSFRAPQQQQSRLLLQRLLDASKNLNSSAQVETELYQWVLSLVLCLHVGCWVRLNWTRTIASTVLDSVYGYQLETAQDPFVVNTNIFIEHLTKAIIPSSTYWLPWMRSSSLTPMLQIFLWTLCLG